MSNHPIATLVTDSRILVCCGAGGVGKTTTAASLGLAGARAGRRVLVLTIDPSKRLAEAMGVSPHETEPQPPPPEFLKAAGIAAPGSLEVWMLDPRYISDTTVKRLAGTPERAKRLLENRVYQNVTSMIAGMQEYTAMEALYRFLEADRYDLVILDTPPSRNALNFLEGPTRLGKFFDGRIFQLFLPQRQGMIRQAASKVIGRVLSAVFGESFYNEFQSFLENFSDIFRVLTTNAVEMREHLSRDDAAFILVTSPSEEAMEEAHFFRAQTKEMNLPFRAFILNRSNAMEMSEKRRPEASDLGKEPLSDAARQGLAKVQAMADQEIESAKEHLALLGQLKREAGPGAVACPLPLFPGGVDDVEGLVTLSKAIMVAKG